VFTRKSTTVHLAVGTTVKKKRPRFTTVRFLDHHTSSETWAVPTKPEELSGAKVEARGWIISENDTVLELSAQKPLDEDDGEWGRPFRIIKSTIYFRSDVKKEKPGEV
jgi:hypothetical protein